MKPLNTPVMRIASFILGSVACLATFAQTQVHQSTFTFSDGAHPTFVVSFDDAEVRDVESWYKDQLKDLAAKLDSKKELRATGARVPEVAADTITVLCKVDQPRRSNAVDVHLAFMVHGVYLNSTSDPTVIAGARNFCYTKAAAYKKEVLQKQLADAERTHTNLVRDHGTLTKDQRRYEQNVVKTRDKGTKAGQEKVQAESDLSNTELSIQTKQIEIATAPTPESTEALTKLLKEQEKLKDRIERLGKQAIAAEKKAKDLEFSITEKLKDQKDKQAAIDTQLKKVEALRLALQAVN